VQRQLDAAQRHESGDGAQQAAEAEAAIAALWRLSDAIQEADGDDLRQLLATTVERIELRFRPMADSRRTECVGGVVHLRGNCLSCSHRLRGLQS
jgi:hypothetical protein